MRHTLPPSILAFRFSFFPFTFSFLLPLLLILLLSTSANAQESSALINKALDTPVNLDIPDNTPLRDAMETIWSKTGVRLKEDPAIWDLLPWGRDTTVKIRIENKTLREALSIITRKLGLSFALRDTFVEILPMPPLQRIGQRASRQELLALDMLATKPLDNLGTDHPTIKLLLEKIDLKLADEKSISLAIENRSADIVPQDRTLFVPRNATLLDGLESIAKETKATWYPWGQSIVVCAKSEVVARSLKQRLTILPNEGGISVIDVLMRVSRETDVPFEFQPGVIQTVPAEARTLHGIIHNARGVDILQQISAATGLAYAIQDDKIMISSASLPADPNRREPMIGFMQLDVGLQVLVPVSQVPPDLQEFIRHKMRKELDKMRKMMQEEGFKPTSPATQPTTRPVAANRDL